MPALSEPAFNELYRKAARALWVYAYRVTTNGADADDIVQETFHRLLRVDLASTAEDELRRYLFRIAGNLMTDRWRRAEREQSWLERLRPHDRAPADPAGHDVSRIFATLKPRERALLWLAYVEQQSHEEIAGSLGVSRASVKVMLSRARARLRAVLAARGLAPRPGAATDPSDRGTAPSTAGS